MVGIQWNEMFMMWGVVALIGVLTITLHHRMTEVRVDIEKHILLCARYMGGLTGAFFSWWIVEGRQIWINEGMPTGWGNTNSNWFATWRVRREAYIIA